MKRQVRHQGDEQDHGSERWLVSYADFITLMFAFFAVLYATSQKDAEKVEKFQDSVKRYLIKAGGIGTSGGQQIEQVTKGNTVLDSPISTVNASKTAATDALDEAETYLEGQLSEADRKKYIVDLSADDWGVRVVIPSSKIFSDGGNKFVAEAIPFLAKLSSMVANTKRKVLVEGHVREGELGGYGSTWEFASARAATVLRFMQKKEKFASSKLAMASLAESRPLAGASEPSLNSRIEIVLLNPDYEF